MFLSCLMLFGWQVVFCFELEFLCWFYDGLGAGLGVFGPVGGFSGWVLRFSGHFGGVDLYGAVLNVV